MPKSLVCMKEHWSRIPLGTNLHAWTKASASALLRTLGITIPSAPRSNIRRHPYRSPSERTDTTVGVFRTNAARTMCSACSSLMELYSAFISTKSNPAAPINSATKGEANDKSHPTTVSPLVSFSFNEFLRNRTSCLNAVRLASGLYARNPPGANYALALYI